MTTEHSTIRELCTAVIDAARCVAEPVQAQILAPDQREMEIRWVGIAFEALSFYIVLATNMAQSTCGTGKAQSMVNALGRCLLPQIEERFFSRNPPEIRSRMLSAFQAAHYQAELEYGQCTKVFPRDYQYDTHSLVSRFAYKLLQIVEKEEANEAILPTIFASIQGPSGAPKIFVLVKSACDALPSDASS